MGTWKTISFVPRPGSTLHLMVNWHWLHTWILLPPARGHHFKSINPQRWALPQTNKNLTVACFTDVQKPIINPRKASCLGSQKTKHINLLIQNEQYKATQSKLCLSTGCNRHTGGGGGQVTTPWFDRRWRLCSHSSFASFGRRLGANSIQGLLAVRVLAAMEATWSSEIRVCRIS